jgi:drug/metabolite transporter (DMT)-like permease
VVPVLFALLSALGYGGSDYAAGIAAREVSVLQLTILAEAASVLVVLLIVPWVSSQAPSAGSIAWGAAAGISGVVGALALYMGFRHEAFNVASSLSAVGSAAFSVLAGLLFGERPSGLSLIGVGLALPAIVGVSASSGQPAGDRGDDRGAARHRPTGRHAAGVIWGLVAGAGFAGLFIGLNRAGSSRDFWPLVVAQLAALAMVCCVGAAARQLRLPSARTCWLAAVSGVTGAIGIICYFIATHAGLLAVTAVITSLYPAGTIVLARVLLGERLTPIRIAGLCLAAGSVALIAAGGAGQG